MLRSAPIAVVAALTCFACDGGDEGFSAEEVTISFAARVADLPFACGQSYSGLGMDGGVATPQDFRFYVYDVRLVAPDGAEYAVTLTDEEVDQGAGVALLDFEDATGACANGTPAQNTTLRGTVQAQARHGGSHEGAGYVGLRFRIGVPEELNHADLTKSPSPLNDTTMSWSWNAGHIFLAAWGKFGGDAPFTVGVHVGSTGCEGDAMAGEVVGCSNENRAEVVLDGFDPSANTVIVDWGALFAGMAVTSPSADCKAENGDTSCACHSFAPEALCRSLFAPLGLDWTSGAASAQQSVFRSL